MKQWWVVPGETGAITELRDVEVPAPRPGQVLVRMAEELWGVAGVLWAGSLVVATVASAVCYPVVWRIVKIEQRKLERVRKQISLRPPPLDAEAEQAPASSSDSEACQRS